jgi:hypothetical protein
MMELANLPVAMHTIQEICQNEAYKNISFELQDILPLPRSSVLMSSSFSESIDKNLGDNSLVAYTMSWAINDKNIDASTRLQQEIQTALYQTKIDGKPLAWLHLTKEFSELDNKEFYRSSAKQLEEILQGYNIEDRIFITNRAQEWIYNNPTNE